MSRLTPISTGASPGPVANTLVQPFEVQAAQRPDAPAVRFHQETLTYSQLNRRANQLAHFLEQHGVGPEVMVGLFMERSLEMVISLYALLKVGGAYVPLDPEYPAERIRFMLEDTGVPLVLTQGYLREKLALNSSQEGEPPLIVCVDSQWESIAAAPTSRPLPGPAANNLAYVIYTSGSTGRPKGVMNEHGAVLNHMRWLQQSYPLSDSDRVLQKTPFSFDVSGIEFFWPLQAGACLVMAEPGGHRDSDYLVDLIVAEQITTIHFVPSMLQAFLLHEEVERCTSLRRVFCSGEALPYALQERFFARLQAELHNLYGPTEAAIHVTYWDCQREGDLGLVPIGRPVANTQIHLLDEQLRPVANGEQGELHIGGVQVARGYLNRPELSAEKFIPDPFGAEPGDRLYKSGDLARHLPDGSIEYIGRADHQVKIRGNRVELGEIEHTLGQHAAVRQVVVTTTEQATGDKRLVAYLVAAREQPVSVAALRDFLAAHLPGYMIPTTFIFLDAMPLTASGKINRRALPEPERAAVALDESYVPPRNAMEQTLAQIWAQVIGLERVGVHDHFLEMGGDSILSIQIAARASQAGLALTPAQLLQYPTVAELARVVGTAPLIAAEQRPVTGGLPLTPFQCRLLQDGPPGLEQQSQSFLLEVDSTVDAALLEEAAGHLLRQHDALRLRCQPGESGWRQEIMAPAEPGPEAVVETRELSALSTAEQAATMQAAVGELAADLSPVQGRLMRLALFQRGRQQPNSLLIIVHRLAIDTLSWRILLEDLDRICRQLQDGTPVALPAKTTSFQYWAQRLQAHARSDAVRREVPFWLAQQPPQPAPLPVEHIQDDATAGAITLALDAPHTQALLTEIPRAYGTRITDALLAGLLQAFSRWTGQRYLLVDLEGHGREAFFEDVDLSRTAGAFSAIYPVLLRLGPHAEPGDNLMAVKEQLRQVPAGGLGYGLLRYLAGDESLASTLRTLPPAGVSFHYVGQLDQLLPPDSLFQLPLDFHGPVPHPAGAAPYRLQITAAIVRGRLLLTWRYRQESQRRETVEELARRFIEALEQLVSAGQLSTAGGYRPSDFPEANLSQQELDELLAEIEQLGG